MKNLTRHSFLLALLLLTLFSCIKDSKTVPSLPPATQNGSNVMAARINGSIWTKFSCTDCIGGGSGLLASFHNGFLQIIGDSINSSKVVSSVEIDVINVTSTGVYTLGLNNGNPITNYGEIKYQKPGNIILTYSTDANNKGTITITKLDVIKHIISGTFSFDASNTDNPSDLKHITEGRFDVPYIFE